MDATYRKLTPDQIGQLRAQGCRAANWDDIEVAGGFDCEGIHGAAFGGKVRIGAGVVITSVGISISDCHIGDGARLEDVSLIECDGESSFGIGVEVAAVNEGGGREVPLHAGMTSQTAYLIAMWRHRTAMRERMYEMIDAERRAAVKPFCTIGEGAVLRNCGTIRNVNIGPYATLNGVQLLENGTVMSTRENPTRVGYGVRAVDFIFAESARVDTRSSLHRSFVGPGSVVEEGFTGVDVLVFSNCMLGAGEAASVFAGPYTVSHHKATLLIAGYFSFFNAGSGANQSNHLFKTGAVHQGINDRGCKYGSNAYMMLPVRNGAFTTILGSHSIHHDTSDFPYSYLMMQDGNSILVPAMGLRNWGLVRDLNKWPARDKRPAGVGDIINFSAYNPYVASKVVRALEISDGLLANPSAEVYTHGRMKIRNAMLRRGRGLYRLALDAALGEMLAGGHDGSWVKGEGEWIDMAGMFAPRILIEQLAADIENGVHKDMASVTAALKKIDAGYSSYAYGWALSRLDPEKATDGAVQAAIARGREAAATLYKYAQDDADHDADQLMATGYGMDYNDDEVVAADFEAVRRVKINRK